MHQTKELEEFLISPLDNDENTIAHLAAKGGHISIFKVKTWLFVFLFIIKGCVRIMMLSFMAS